MTQKNKLNTHEVDLLADIVMIHINDLMKFKIRGDCKQLEQASMEIEILQEILRKLRSQVLEDEQPT